MYNKKKSLQYSFAFVDTSSINVTNTPYMEDEDIVEKSGTASNTCHAEEELIMEKSVIDLCSQSPVSLSSTRKENFTPTIRNEFDALMTKCNNSNSYNQYVTLIRNSQEYMDKTFSNDMLVIKKNHNHASLLQNVLVPFVKGIKLDITVGHVKNQLLLDDWFNDEIINDWAKLLNERFNRNK
jgi:hypothetical protein